LLQPLEADVVDGSEVTFEWEPVEGASAYVLQVATAASFDDVVLEETFENATAATIADFFPSDQRTFFWRVLATNDSGGTSPGQNVESFIAASEEDARRHGALPGSDEEMGPVTELVRSAKDDVARRVFSEADRFEREKEVGVAYEGVAAGQIAAIMFSIVLVIAVAATVVFFWVGMAAQETTQGSVDAENYTTLRQARLDAAEQLEQYRVIDEEEGIYQIPIDRAMDIIANEEYQSQSPEGEGSVPSPGNGDTAQ
jgi:hypothetical protein